MAKFSNRPHKRPSKRQPLKLKHKIEKKVRDHKKKLKKEAKNLRMMGVIKRHKKNDVDIPNLFPLKAQMIDGLQRKKDEKERQKQIAQLQRENKQLDIDFVNSEQREKKFEEEKSEIPQLEIVQKGGKKYYKEIKKVIETADILLEVLDARDPLSCRCRNIEAEILGMQGNKKIILVLNKIDLVPSGNAEAWVRHLRREYATVLFKANTQNQQQHLSSNTLYRKSLLQREDLAESMINSSKAVGAEKLIELIKNYSKTDGIKKAVTVGVIGYPNVGKSSLINSLKRSKACAVSSTPGFTKNLQEVQIDSKVTILDCPGVIFDDSSKEDSSILRNIIKIDEIEDPIAPVQLILNKVAKNDLLLHYKIADFQQVTEFLVHIALARGKMIKGGIPDLKAAARIVLHDWNIGKIKYFTFPPQDVTATEDEQIEEEIRTKAAASN